MIKNKRIVVFSELEKRAFYGLPNFDDNDRKKYFTFTEQEINLIAQNKESNTKLYCAIQMGYFKFMKAFFYLSWQEFNTKDLCFLKDNYFPDISLPFSGSTKHIHYSQRLKIMTLYGYKDWSEKYKKN